MKILNTIILREKRLPWFGQVERSSGANKTVCDMQIEGKLGPGQPNMTWKTLTERETVMSGISRRLSLVIGMCGHPV